VHLFHHPESVFGICSERRLACALAEAVALLSCGPHFQLVHICKPVSLLYYSSMTGLAELTRVLLDIGAEVHEQGGIYGNALQAVSYDGGPRDDYRAIALQGR
jgi:hypothetical protein